MTTGHDEQRSQTPSLYPFQRLPWWHRLWRRIWCPLDGHGGIATTHPGGYFAPDGHCFCKRCGARVKLV